MVTPDHDGLGDPVEDDSTHHSPSFGNVGPSPISRARSASPRPLSTSQRNTRTSAPEAGPAPLIRDVPAAAPSPSAGGDATSRWRGVNPQSTAPAPAPAAAPQHVDEQPQVAAEADPYPQSFDAPVEETRRSRSKQPRKVRKVRVSRPASAEREGSDFPVPVPGGKLSGGRGVSTTVRAVLVGTACLLSLATCGTLSYVAGTGSVAPSGSGALNSSDITKYGLSTYNTQAGSAFADTYLRSCLTRYPLGKSDAPDPRDAPRVAATTAMTVGVPDPACVAARGQGATPPPARGVLVVTPTGVPAPVQGYPNARYLSMLVTTTDGVTSTYVVPVNLDNPATGAGPAVIGALGVMPAPAVGEPHSDGAVAVTDPALASELGEKFLPEFMTSWTASSGTLTQFLTADSTPLAVNGLRGLYSKPAITKVTVYPSPESIIGEKNGPQTIEYKDGQPVTVVVSATVTMPDKVNTMASTWRLTMTRIGDHWFVLDIAGGGADPAANPPAATPTTSLATP